MMRQQTEGVLTQGQARPFVGAGLVAAALLLLPAASVAHRPYLHAPAVEDYARHDPSGTTILGNGRFLRPAGRHLPVARWPHGLTLSPDGELAFVASEGVGQLIAGWDGPNPRVRLLDPGATKEGDRRANAGAAVFSPDGSTLYWSSGETGAVYVFDVASREKRGEISLNAPADGRSYTDSFAMDLKLSADGRYLYAADVTNFRVAVIDTRERRVAGSVRVGRYPYALAVSGSRVFVANIGMFEYRPIPPPSSLRYDRRGLAFPAYGFPSDAARDGVTAEGRQVPGLGDPNAPESFSVWGIDVSRPDAPRVVSRMKTGILVGAPAEGGRAVGGSAPNFLAVRGDDLYVSDGNNDMVERFNLRMAWPGRGIGLTTRSARDTETQRRHGASERESGLLIESENPSRLGSGEVTERKEGVSRGSDEGRPSGPAARVRIVPSPLVAGLRGVGPCGMALSPDGRRLYVAESGINAVAVLDAHRLRVLGHVPTAWYPYRLAVSHDGRRLACICFKGFGNGPNAGSQVPKTSFLGMKGVFSTIPVPADRDLPRLTQTVLQCNGIVDAGRDRARLSSPLVPTEPGRVSPQIRYVVFITKENHTYDTIFDRVPGASSDPSLLRWGLHQQIRQAGEQTLNDAAVMTNHNALARQFTVSDNFYMEPEASGVGHRWLVGVQPNNWCQMTYTLGWQFKADSPAPGRRASFGSNGSIVPEDYPEAGSMWEHLARHGISFRNYGEGFEFAGVAEDDGEAKTGAREVVNIPMPKVLYDNTCRDYPIFNMNIPDQYRADWFAQDFTKLFLSGGREMPSFVNIAICNDHGTDPAPKRGYPYLASWMADNDLALGRIVEFLSHTPYWPHMAIFVTQDDSGGEPDHVDAQRSVLLVISPWAKRGYVSHRHTTITSMHRTLYEILGLPPLNMFDALANDFSDCFTTTPDFRPYEHTAVDKRIFDVAKTKNPLDPDFRQARRTPSIPMDDPDEVQRLLRY